MQTWPEPQPITDAQKNGERFLVWVDDKVGYWTLGRWRTEDPFKWCWQLADNVWRPGSAVKFYLPLPPDVKP